MPRPDSPKPARLFPPARRRTKAALFFVLLAAAAGLVVLSPDGGSTAAAQKAQYDLVIRGGRVVDGTGRAGFVADVAVNGDRVAFVGRLARDVGARRVIDARGLGVAPGCIDMLGQSEENGLIE